MVEISVVRFYYLLSLQIIGVFIIQEYCRCGGRGGAREAENDLARRFIGKIRHGSSILQDDNNKRP